MAHAQQEDEDQVQEPARVTALHVRDRPTSKNAGAPLAWRKLTQLEAAYNAEKLGARDSDEAHNRLTAGKKYEGWFNASQGSSSDSTQAFNVSGSMGSGLPFGMAQQAALRAVVSVENGLGVRDKIIVRDVLGFGYTIAEAMRHAKLCRDVRASSRFCEALDALADVIAALENKSRRRG